MCVNKEVHRREEEEEERGEGAQELARLLVVRHQELERHFAAVCMHARTHVHVIGH
jgi:hypothetical protein